MGYPTAWGRKHRRTPEAECREGFEQSSRQGLERASGEGKRGSVGNTEGSRQRAQGSLQQRQCEKKKGNGHIRKRRLENPVCQAHAPAISQVQMCEPEQAAAGICSHTTLPQTGAAAAHLGDTHRHSFSSEKEVAYR